MKNYYKEERYPRSVIRDFVGSQRNLEQSSPMTAQEVKSDDFFSLSVGMADGPIELLYRFTDDEQRTPALGFTRLEEQEEDDEEVYVLAYIDPSLDLLWKYEMDRDQE